MTTDMTAASILAGAIRMRVLEELSRYEQSSHTLGPQPFLDNYQSVMNLANLFTTLASEYRNIGQRLRQFNEQQGITHPDTVDARAFRANAAIVQWWQSLQSIVKKQVAAEELLQARAQAEADTGELIEVNDSDFEDTNPESTTAESGLIKPSNPWDFKKTF